MVLSMTEKGPNEKDSAEFGNDSEASGSMPVCGFSLSEELPDESSDSVELVEKPEMNQLERTLLREALGFSKNSDAKWFDARGQSGPSPADFGDHKPIPIDAVCASIVISEEEED